MGSKKPSKRAVQFRFTSRHTVPTSIPSSNYSPNLRRSCVKLPHILSRMPRSPSGASARPSPHVSIKSLELNALHISQIQDMVHLNGNRSNVIVERGDRNVIHKVAANYGATFSRIGMSTLVLRAENDDELIETIAARSDVSPFVFGQLINYATEQVRNHLIASARPELRAALAQITHRISERITLRSSFANDWAAAERLVNSFAQDTGLTRTKVLEFADGNKITETVVVLSVLSKIPTELICKLVSDQYGFGAMVLCKAINLDWCTAHAVLTVNLFAKTSRAMELEELDEDFERLSVSSAQRILWYWRGRIKVQSAITGREI